MASPERMTFGKYYDLFMLILSVYVVLVLSLTVIIRIPERVVVILDWVDLAICIIFLLDWLFFLIRSSDKRRYVQRRIIDLAGSIPLVQILRPLRIFRIVRLAKALRLVRGLKGSSRILKVLLENPARSALTIYLSLTFLIYFYCSLGLYTYEFGVNESIQSFGDVLWMSFTTITTVGYGDIYPVTTAGRILSSVLVITGMGLFGLVTAEVATLILRLMKQDEA